MKKHTCRNWIFFRILCFCGFLRGFVKVVRKKAKFLVWVVDGARNQRHEGCWECFCCFLAILKTFSRFCCCELLLCFILKELRACLLRLFVGRHWKPLEKAIVWEEKKMDILRSNVLSRVFGLDDMIDQFVFGWHFFFVSEEIFFF